MKHWIARLRKCVGYLFAGYLLIVLVGLIPVNNDFRQPDDGIRIYVVSNEVHADIIMPVRTDLIDWSEEFKDATFGSETYGYSHVAIGWGDKGFFLETPTWSEFKISTAANALLLPSSSCLHVSYTNPEFHPEAASVVVSKEQYEKLVLFFKSSFEKSEANKPIQIPGYSYGSNDAFFEAKGRYHLLNTCNSWVGRALKQAGVRVPWLSPMPRTPALYF